MPAFTNYHQPYVAAWRQLLERAKWDADAPKTVVEVGSYEGSSACWMLSEMLRSAESQLYCIDAWVGDEGPARFDRFMANLQEVEPKARVEVLRGWSQDGLRELLRRGVKADLLYIDGGHDAPTVLRDLVTGFDLVRVGGLIICDDYLWQDPRFGGNRTLGRPKIAIDAFTTIYADKAKIIGGMTNVQVYMQKVAD